MKKIKVGLIIDEFFGGARTAFGGYGFLARNIICKYIPDENIQIDVLLGKGKHHMFAQKFHVDDVDLYRLPRRKFFARRWLERQNYDLYLSIELTGNFVLANEPDKNKKLVLWIQDPRPKSDWDEIKSMTLFPEPCYYNQKIYDLVNLLNKQKRVKFITQGYGLIEKAVDLYDLPENTPVQYVPNPVNVDYDIKNLNNKKNNVIFLGRLESVKRGWLFCEMARKLPQYNFIVLGGN